MDVFVCADAVHRRSGRRGPDADWRGEVAPSGGGERTEHPEGGNTNVQRRRTVRRRHPKSSLSPLHFPFHIFLFSPPFPPSSCTKMDFPPPPPHIRRGFKSDMLSVFIHEFISLFSPLLPLCPSSSRPDDLSTRMSEGFSGGVTGRIVGQG